MAILNTHCVVVTTGSAGDLFPFLKLAEGLRQRGFPVTFVAPELHAPLVRQAGLDCHGTVADPAVLNDPDLWHPRRGFAVVWRAVRPGLRELLPLVGVSLPVDVQQIRELMDDPDGFAQEFLCQFLDTTNVLLPYDLIALVEDEATIDAHDTLVLKKLRVIWLDAHTDVNNETISPSGNVHGMPVSVLAQVLAQTQASPGPG